MGAARKPPPRPALPRRRTARELRDMLERGIEHLVQILDEIDGEVDEEPSLGSSCTSAWADQRDWARGNLSDREQDDSDDEPSLGALEHPGRHPGVHPLDQTSWGASGSDDREDECEDEGVDSDSEPDVPDVEPTYAEGGLDQTRIAGPPLLRVG